MPSFLIEHMDEILAEWETFAKTLTPAAATMDATALRDHAKQMLETIAKDIATDQTERQQTLKSKGLAPTSPGVATAAATHGVLRHQVGFDLSQLVAEFRALRASVLRLWVAKEKFGDADNAYEIARFNEAIDQALAESVATYSEELARSREMFLGILGHDLRSPLGAVSAALQVLNTSKDESVRSRAASTGARGVASMAAMIRDLLQYTRTRLGKGIPITTAPADLGDVVRKVIDEIALVYPHTEFRFEPAGSLAGQFDSERMHQAISNLMNNAVQHGPRGEPIDLVASGDGDALRFSVNNGGAAISPKNLQVIFQPLVQLPVDGNTAPSSNLGLGLFIAREIVRAHGGSLDVTSSTADGTTFTAILPR